MLGNQARNKMKPIKSLKGKRIALLGLGISQIDYVIGKENGKEDGRIVYAITMYIAENQMAAVAETQTSADVCVLFRTYDIQVNPNLVKPGLTL